MRQWAVPRATVGWGLVAEVHRCLDRRALLLSRLGIVLWYLVGSSSRRSAQGGGGVVGRCQAPGGGPSEPSYKATTGVTVRTGYVTQVNRKQPQLQ